MTGDAWYRPSKFEERWGCYRATTAFSNDPNGPMPLSFVGHTSHIPSPRERRDPQSMLVRQCSPPWWLAKKSFRHEGALDQMSSIIHLPRTALEQRSKTVRRAQWPCRRVVDDKVLFTFLKLHLNRSNTVRRTQRPCRRVVDDKPSLWLSYLCSSSTLFPTLTNYSSRVSLHQSAELDRLPRHLRTTTRRPALQVDRRTSSSRKPCVDTHRALKARTNRAAYEI